MLGKQVGTEDGWHMWGMGGVSAGMPHCFYSTFISPLLPHLGAMASTHGHVWQEHVSHEAQPPPTQHLAGPRWWHTCRADPLHKSALVLAVMDHTWQSPVPEDPAPPWAGSVQRQQAVCMPPRCSVLPTCPQACSSFPQFCPGPALTGTSSCSFPLFLTVCFAPPQARGCFSVSSFGYVEAIFRMFAALWCPAALQGCPLFPGPVRLLADIFPVSALQPPDVCAFSLQPGYLCNSSHQQGTLSLLNYRVVSLEIHV